jgi:hypothetical protein
MEIDKINFLLVRKNGVGNLISGVGNFITKI